MNQLSNQQIEEALRNSECLISSFLKWVVAYERLAVVSTRIYGSKSHWWWWWWMAGWFPAGQLLTQFTFYHHMYYPCYTLSQQPRHQWTWMEIQTRNWFGGEDILLIDDILMKALPKTGGGKRAGSKKIQNLSRTCVLLNKLHDRKVQESLSRFCGSRCGGSLCVWLRYGLSRYLRHMPGIYALKMCKLVMS